MSLPEGFENISPMPWRHKAGSVDLVVSAIGDTICSDQSFSHVETDPEDQFLIARAPDHALLLAAITKGLATVVVVPDWRDGAVVFDSGEIRVDVFDAGEPVFDDNGDQDYNIYTYTLDSFGCPILTDECRAAIIKAMEAGK